MEIVIVIFKSGLEAHPTLAHQLGSISQETAQLGQACIYVPQPGKAGQMLALLQTHKIRFGMHQSQGQVRQETDDSLAT